MSDNVVLLSGDLRIDILTPDGASTGFQELEAEALKITPKSKLIELASKKRDSYGQPFFTGAIPQPTEFELQLSEVSREILAALLAGTISTFTQVVGALPEVVVKAIAGRWVSLGAIGLSGAVVKSQDGITTYAEGDDYILDKELGMIQIVESGDITAGSMLGVVPSLKAMTGNRITGSTRYQFKMELFLNGLNLATNEKVYFHAYQAFVTPSDAQDFLGDKPMMATLKGRLNVPAGKSEPYELRVIDTVV
jgi:hypothetical protein